MKFIETVHGVKTKVPDKTEPAHYDGANGSRLIDITSCCDFVTGNAIKYLFRAGRKSGESAMDDLRKARWYVEKAIEMESSKDND